jgi:CheY-like chemotaxis protein
MIFGIFSATASACEIDATPLPTADFGLNFHSFSKENITVMTTSPTKGKYILLVEDRPDHCDLLSVTLEEYRLVRARNFAEGLRFATEKYFDLYILDNWLPDGTGIDLCQRIREFDPHTPILFCSAVAGEPDIQEGMSAGAQAYLVKPINFEELQLTVARLINVAPNTALKARRAEITAIREELADQRFERDECIEKVRERSQKARERSGRAIDRCLTANRKFLRLKAMQAYLAAGGTRGDFAREWLDEISPPRCSTPEPDEAKSLLKPFQICRATLG